MLKQHLFVLLQQKGLHQVEYCIYIQYFILTLDTNRLLQRLNIMNIHRSNLNVNWYLKIRSTNIHWLNLDVNAKFHPPLFPHEFVFIVAFVCCYNRL